MRTWIVAASLAVSGCSRPTPQNPSPPPPVAETAAPSPSESPPPPAPVEETAELSLAPPPPPPPPGARPGPSAPPASPLDPPPPPPPGAPLSVPPAVLEGVRIAGDKAIVPDDATKVAIARAGRERLVGSLKLCVDDTGAVTVVSLLKSTGFPDYDAKLEREMRKWRYRPYEVNGQAARVCTAVTFIYKQDPPAPPTRGTP